MYADARHDGIYGRPCFVDARQEALVRRLACQRIGRDDAGAAFGDDELSRLRRFLAFAGAAEGRLITSQRRAHRAA